MKELYEKILKKPKSYRKKLAYILTILFGLIIFFLWMIITVDNFQSTFKEIGAGDSLKKQIPSLKEKYKESQQKNETLKKELEKVEY